MNLFVVIGDEIATPPLGGTILPGITRQTVLTLAREWGLNIVERPIAFDEILEPPTKNGTLREIFGSGTAAVISSVGELGHAKGTITINHGEVGPIATAPLRRDHVGPVRDRARSAQLAHLRRLNVLTPPRSPASTLRTSAPR